MLNETAKLHAGDAENRRLWEEFLPKCEDEINRVYNRLDVHFDHTLGESFYEDRLAAVVDELLAKGIAQESDGAICVFFTDQDAPMIVRKQDGAFLYATTDLATIRYRMETWRPDADFVRRRSSAEPAFPAAFCGGKAVGIRQRSSFSTSVSARCWAKTAGPLKPDPAIPSAWKACWTRPCAARPRS